MKSNQALIKGLPPINFIQLSLVLLIAEVHIDKTDQIDQFDPWDAFSPVGQGQRPPRGQANFCKTIKVKSNLVNVYDFEWFNWEAHSIGWSKVISMLSPFLYTWKRLRSFPIRPEEDLTYICICSAMLQWVYAIYTCMEMLCMHIQTQFYIYAFWMCKSQVYIHLIDDHTYMNAWVLLKMHVFKFQRSIHAPCIGAPSHAESLYYIETAHHYAERSICDLVPTWRRTLKHAFCRRITCLAAIARSIWSTTSDKPCHHRTR